MRVWKIAPGRKAAYWKQDGPHAFASINWLVDVDFTKLTREEIIEALKKSDQGSTNNRNSIWSFVNDIQEGDIVVASDGLRKAVAVGEITSGYLPPNDQNNPNRAQDFHTHVRLVEWISTAPIDFEKNVFNQPTVHVLKEGNWQHILKCYQRLQPKVAKKLSELISETRTIKEENALDNDDEYFTTDTDTRARVMREVRVRRGQKRFRDSLITNYAGQCPISGCKVLSLLEAAHIDPYRGDHSNSPKNGLLLRADIHTLFDLGMIGIKPDTYVVEVHPTLLADAYYAQLAGNKIKFKPEAAPATNALKKRYKWFLAHLP